MSDSDESRELSDSGESRELSDYDYDPGRSRTTLASLFNSNNRNLFLPQNLVFFGSNVNPFSEFHNTIPDIRNMLGRVGQRGTFSRTDGLLMQVLLARLSVMEMHYQFQLTEAITRSIEESDKPGPPPATSDDISNLLSVTFNPTTYDVLACAVCLEAFVPGGIVKKLPCSHIYCEECIVSWLKQHGTCPMCRIEVKNVAPLIKVAEPLPKSDTNICCDNENEIISRPCSNNNININSSFDDNASSRVSHTSYSSNLPDISVYASSTPSPIPSDEDIPNINTNNNGSSIGDNILTVSNTPSSPLHSSSDETIASSIDSCTTASSLAEIFEEDDGTSYVNTSPLRTSSNALQMLDSQTRLACLPIPGSSSIPLSSSNLSSNISRRDIRSLRRRSIPNLPRLSYRDQFRQLRR